MCSGRKHTPIVSERQRKFFGYAMSGKVSGLSRAEAKRHLKEVKGKKLPHSLGSNNVRGR